MIVLTLHLTHHTSRRYTFVHGNRRAQSDERAIVATVTKFLDGIRTRDTSLMRSTVVSGRHEEI